MIKLIIGNKGSGKTKKLVDLVNSCVENSDGNVVCVEKEPKLTYDISSKARLLETETYSINGCKAFTDSLPESVPETMMLPMFL